MKSQNPTAALPSPAGASAPAVAADPDTLTLHTEVLSALVAPGGAARGAELAVLATRARVPDILRRLAACQPPSTAIVARDRAMLLLGFSAALPTSEFVAAARQCRAGPRPQVAAAGPPL